MIFERKSCSLPVIASEKKPLFYSLDERGNFIFGSELKSLIAHGDISKEIDFAALDAYLTFGYVPEEFCIFKNVQKLAPGSFLIFKDGEIRNEQYWDFAYTENSAIKTEAEYIEILREKLKEAVKIRLISEVPLGAFLSGGVDSSAIVAMMSKISDAPVKTFSIGFNEDSFDELKFARIAAKHFNTEHHEFIVTPDLIEILDDLVWHFDEPFADSSALPTFMVAKLAREFVTVVLSGDGGDELFAGYTRYVTDQKRGGFAKLPKFIRQNILQKISEKMPHEAKGKNYLYNASLNAVERYIDSISHFGDLKKRRALFKRFSGEIKRPVLAKARKCISKSPTRLHRKIQLISCCISTAKLICHRIILTKVDRMTMANSLEARVPLLDQELIEFVETIPAELKLKNLETKYIFKKALEGIVPDEILYREKQGFGVPINEWINSQLKERIHSTLLEKKTLERGYFDEKYIKVLLNEHQTKRRDHSHSLWILLMLELWHRQFVDI